MRIGVAYEKAIARVKELEAEVKAQHDEHIARYGQAM